MSAISTSALKLPTHPSTSPGGSGSSTPLPGGNVGASARNSAKGGVKLPQIRNAQDAKELEDEKAAKAAAKKQKAALTPAEKRAAKLRAEQAKEEAEAAKKL